MTTRRGPDNSTLFITLSVVDLECVGGFADIIAGVVAAWNWFVWICQMFFQLNEWMVVGINEYMAAQLVGSDDDG